MPSFFLSQPLDVGSNVILTIFLIAFVGVIIYYFFKTVEIVYVMRKKKPFYVHLYFSKRKLSQAQKSILEQKFSFYKKLLPREQEYFEHRIALFIKDKDFVGRDGLKVTDEMRVLIASTAVMLTFGFRDFYIGLIDKIFIYPNSFYSKANDEYHHGEFNPKLHALVLSWSHFQEGYDIENDNQNLGIHEFTHAIQLNSLKERDVSSTVFQDSYKELIEILSNEEGLREQLVSAKYFRDYAYTNQYEFIAVIIETFIESPKELYSKFPQVYNKVKQMLNFNYAGY